MALPAGVTTATVIAGVPVTHTGAAVKAFVSIEPSAYLVHAATGTPLVDFIEELDISEGTAGQFILPHTDQSGFIDGSGAAYTNWYYTARVTYSTPSKAKTKAPKVKVFQLTTGQTTIDLDLLPEGAPALPYTAPSAKVDAFMGRTGAVTLLDADMPERLSETELSATYASMDKLRGGVPTWAPATAYIQGAPVLAPDGSMVNAVAAFTSGATYDPINWTSSKGAVSEAGTQVGSPPVIKPAGDTRAGVWEYVHNSSVGYLWHLLVGSGTSSGSWIMGVGIDSGLGNGFIFRNKAQGIGLKVENTATISSATAYGLFVEQKSALAPAMNIQQRDEGTATALELISFCDDATAKIMTVNGYAGRAFDIESNSGKVNISKGVEVIGNYVDIREDNGVPVAQRGRLKVNATNGLTWHSPAGTDNQWWPFRITEGGSGLYFQAAGLSATPDSATFTTVIGIKNAQLGFFGVTPASRPAAIAAPTAGTTIDTEARAAINSIRAALTTLGLTS